MDATTESIILREHVLAHKDEIVALAKQYGVKNVRIFGSVAKGCAHQNSDIDILVSDPNRQTYFKLGALHTELNKLFKQPVDLVIEELLDPTVKAHIFSKKTIKL
ncbi:MAG: nucleotidyltransferase domain-containing protein [Coriobacteriales bacterium]|nr:nucleotidyltransferase domain-containing protein [Coriobacteriales bacterium]